MTQEKINSGDRCPPAFTEACVLDDGTRSPYYHEGQCVNSSEETAP